jgi:hypothetical protein
MAKPPFEEARTVFDALSRARPGAVMKLPAVEGADLRWARGHRMEPKHRCGNQARTDSDCEAYVRAREADQAR